MKIITVGIHGKAGSGKGTFTKFLMQAAHKHKRFFKSRRIAFAYHVKRIAREEFGYHERLKSDPRWRRLLMLLGTEIGRECVDMDFWVKKWCYMCQAFVKKYQDEKDDRLLMIIGDDVRFDNEMTQVKLFKGILLKVADRQYNLGKLAKHKSEDGLADKNFDIVIYNDGTLTELKETVQEILEYIVEAIDES